MLLSGTCLGPSFMVDSDVGLQMDRVYFSKDEEEEEEGGLERPQGGMEERIRALCSAKSRRLGIRELPSLSRNL